MKQINPSETLHVPGRSSENQNDLSARPLVRTEPQKGTRKLKSFEWLDCTNNKVLNVAIAQTIKFRMSRLHKQ